MKSGYLEKTKDGQYIVIADEPIKEGSNCFDMTTEMIIKFDDNMPLDSDPYFIVAYEKDIPKHLLDNTEIGEDIEW